MVVVCGSAQTVSVVTLQILPEFKISLMQHLSAPPGKPLQPVPPQAPHPLSQQTPSRSKPFAQRFASSQHSESAQVSLAQAMLAMTDLSTKPTPHEYPLHVTSSQQSESAQVSLAQAIETIPGLSTKPSPHEYSLQVSCSQHSDSEQVSFSQMMLLIPALATMPSESSPHEYPRHVTSVLFVLV